MALAARSPRNGILAHEYKYEALFPFQSMDSLTCVIVLHYFSRSPFHDATSNNATVITQAYFNPNMVHTVETREAFEARLRTMQGLEFMVTHDPSENDTKQNHSGVWVIRKQMRRKRHGQADEITPIKSYFVVGENIYVAPSIENVLNCRLVVTVISKRGGAHLTNRMAALNRHITDQNAVSGIYFAGFYSGHWSYIPSACCQKSYSSIKSANNSK